MTSKEAAEIYVDLVRLEESLASDQHQAKQEVSTLRSKYHDLFTQALREAGIECADCFEAASRAFEFVSWESVRHPMYLSGVQAKQSMEASNACWKP